MSIVAIDFETYYDNEYTLKKLTTEQYIRDPRFEVIGVSKKVDDEPAVWFTGTDSEIKEFLYDGVDYSKSFMLAHNTAFDGAIANWKYGIDAKLYLDTMSMARRRHIRYMGVSLHTLSKHYGIGIKGTEVQRAVSKRRGDFTPVELANYGSYSINDTELCYKLFPILLEDMPTKELSVIDITLRMFIDPKLRLDRGVLDRHLSEVLERRAALLEKFGGEDAASSFRSNEQFAELLKQHGVDPPRKVSKTTGKLTYAFAKTDKGMQELLKHDNPEIVELAECRVGIKSSIEQTRTESLIGISERGLLPVSLNYWGAGTGRYTGGEKINLQNLPRGGNLRKAILAPEGYSIVTSDLSQIEARLLAYVAGEHDLVEAFRESRDIYSEFASKVYLREITKADKTERFVGKTCILGLGYGMGALRLMETLRIGLGGISVNVSLEEATAMVQLYRQTYSKIRNMWTYAGRALEPLAYGTGGHALNNRDMPFPIELAPEKVILPTKNFLTYPSIKSTGNGEWVYYNRLLPTKITGPLLVENIIQALAREVIVGYMVEISKKYRIVLQVHDEIVCIAKSDEAEKAAQYVQSVMSTPPDWLPNFPVACEVGIGLSYGEAK